MFRRLFRSLTRQRLASTLVLATVAANLYVDYQLFLRNPRELEAQAKRFIRAALPGYRAQFGPRTEFNLFSGRLKLFDVKFHRKDHPEEVLFEVPELYVESDGLLPTRLSLRAIGPVANLELGPEGLRGIELPEGEEGAPESLPVDLEVTIEGGRVRLRIDQVEGIDADLLFTKIGTLPTRPLQVRKDLSCEGALALYVGALVPRPAGEGPAPDLPGVPDDKAARAVIPELQVELSRARGAPVALNVGGRASITPLLRSLIPRKFQEGVWDQLGVLRGEADLGARVLLPQDGVKTVDVSIVPHGAALKPKGFPVELSEIEGGRFEVTVAIPPQGPPRYLGVGWEGLSAKISAERPGDPGLGELRSRGIVYPGRAGEGVSMQIQVVARELPLAPQLVRAFPPAIHRVYQQFDPQGTIPEAHVMIFKGPEERDVLVLRDGQRIRGLLDPRARLVEDELGRLVPVPEQPLRAASGEPALRFTSYRGQELLVPASDVLEVGRNDSPQISVWVPHLDGRASACFEGVPARLERIQGWFLLTEGANVELKAEGQLALGGRAVVEARVMHGDVISVDVHARDVPVGPPLVAVMPGKSKEMVAPFQLEGGHLDVDVTVEKPRPDAPIAPVVKARLRGVSFDHTAASIPLVASGSLEVRPRFERADQGEPSRIDLALDLALEGKGVSAAVASGTLSLPPHQPERGLDFSGDLSGRVGRVEVAVLPAPIRELLDVVRPAGAARDVVARVRGPKDLRVRGRGEGLSVRPRAFDVPLELSRFDVEVGAERVTLHRVEGGRLGPQGGRLEGSGWVGLEGAEDGAEGPPDLSLALQLEGLPLDQALVRALPPAPRDALLRFQAEGRLGGKLALDLRRGAPPRYAGELTLRDANLTLHEVHERLAQLEQAPLSQVSGQIELSPERVVLREVHGRIAGAALRVPQGELRLDPERGELIGFDLPAELRGLVIDARTRPLAGPAVEPVWKRFRTDGPADLDLRAFQRDPQDEVHVHLRARLLGAQVVADLFPVPVTELRGEVRVEDGEPVFLDLAGRLSPAPLEGGYGAADPQAARVRVWRDASQEGRFPQGGKAGRAYRLTVEGFQRYPSVEGPDRPRSLRERFERELPRSWREKLDHFDPAGRFDVEAWFYQPLDEEAPLRWVAEARLRDGALTLVEPDEPPPPGERGGIAFTGLEGVARLRGRLSEMERGSCEGELRLVTADLFKQTFRDLRGPLRVRDGRLSFGVPGQPFQTSFYDGDLVGRSDYDFVSGAYQTSIALGLGRGARPGRLATAMKELGELSEDPSKRPSFPYKGRLLARLDFDGGGRDLLNQERPFRGRGQLQLLESNLLDTPFLKALQTLVAKLRGSLAADPLPNLNVEFTLDDRGLALKTADLWGRDLKVHGENGELRYDGHIDIDVVPFDTTGGLHELLKWVPGTGYRYRGLIQEGPSLTPYLNPLSTIDWFRDLMQPDPEKKKKKQKTPPEHEEKEPADEPAPPKPERTEGGSQ
ncbi:MAG: hypothetical protein AB7N76_03245 [Planctomycetota bacterium]